MARKKKATTTTLPMATALYFMDCNFATPNLSDLLIFDFTQDHRYSKAHTSDTLPLPRGGDFLQRYDLINAPVMDGEEVDYWVTGIIDAWGHGMVTIIDNNGTHHYTTMEAVEEASELIAAAVADEGFIQLEKGLIEYVSSIQESLAA